jgi:iron complex transport system substrate-binding protein
MTDTQLRALSRRRFLGLLGAAGGSALLVACGAPAPASSGTPATTAAAAYPRTVRDQFEDVTLEAQPQRILMNDGYMIALDVLLAMGVKPAMIVAWEGWELASYQSAAADVPVLLTAGELNLERVLAERIDLILMSAYPTAPVDFKRIPNNPLPVISLPQGDFEAQLRMVGAALNMEQRADELAAQVAQTLAGFKPARMPASVKAFGTYGDGSFYLYKPDSGFSKTLERFGLPPLSVSSTVGDQMIDPEAVHNISLEQMAEMEADLLIGLNYDDATFNTVAGSPLFAQLDSVAQGRFVQLNQEEALATAYASALSLPLVRDVLTRALGAA